MPRNAWSISSGITLPFTYESLVCFSGISILENIEMPWGDYGDLLLTGIMSTDESGKYVIERTGSYTPQIVISGVWHLIVCDELKKEFDHSLLTGFEIEEIKKEKIVEINWENWSMQCDEPEFYPDSGEPEGYIYENEHSTSASAEMGTLWIMKLIKSGYLKENRLLNYVEYDFFMPENKGIIVVSEKGKKLLESKVTQKWITFKLLNS